jgi:tetratricopeptide (TPR) repeat protein
METLEEIIEIADRLVETNMLEEAIDYLDAGIEEHPDNPDLLDLRGIAWFRSLEIDHAIKDWRTAISADTSYHLAYLHLAQVYIEKQEFKEAESNINEALKIEPENLVYQYTYAFIKLQLKEIENCMRVCNNILGKYSTDLTALEYRANCYLEMKNYALAAADFETVCMNSPESPLLCNNTGYSYSKAGNIEKAKQYLSMAIQFDPDFSYPYSNLGYVYLLEGNFTKAHQLIDKSTELDPSNSYAYKNKALVFMAENDNWNARKSLEKARSLRFDLYYGDEVDNLLRNL